MKRLLLAAVIFAFGVGSAFSTEYNPVANPKAVVRVGQARFTVLTPRVIRLEWQKKAQFEDHATLVFVNRNLPVPNFKKRIRNGWLEISTRALKLRYKVGSGKFRADNLSIAFTVDGAQKIWHPGMKNTGNLGGTTRTLDGYNGGVRMRTGKKIDLGQGLISRDGWVLIDDSSRPIFDQSDWPWVQARPHPDGQDWYFFGYGLKYKQALADFVQIAGRIPIPPRFAFGIWWSRYWEYTDSELRELVGQFQNHRVPLDVLVVDIDWHIRFLPQWYKNGKLQRDQAGQSYGWTGYTWSKSYFPDPKDFLDWTERESLKVCLNLHPAAGIQPHEAVYPQMARAMGIDPKTKRYVPFDIVNKKFARNYMNLVIHPLEKMGVDFWWLDWQQWSTTQIPGVNPTFYLNYVFFSDMEREHRNRPLIFHRYGGLGNHRYQIGFSGDTWITWRSLDFQPYFTITASNVGFGYWSHDIGGHTHGKSEPEMFTRWIQWGALSPIFRTHCTKSPQIERRIWGYPFPYYKAMRRAMLLRHSLIPYIYTAAREAYETGVSLCRPLYYEYPRRQEAYRFKNEYFYGDNLLVEPVTRPLGKDSLFVEQSLWLPPGQWIEWESGTLLRGDRVIHRPFALNEIPIYVKAGAIVPQENPLNFAQNPQVDPLILTIFPGDSGSFQLYEDEGNTDAYKTGAFAKTRISFRREKPGTLEVTIDPPKGKYPGMLTERAYEIRLPLTLPPVSVRVNGKVLPHTRYLSRNAWCYNGNNLETQLLTPELKIDQPVHIQVIVPEFAEARLSGMKGKMAHLLTFAKFLARHRWDRSKYSNRLVVRTAQTGLVLSQKPQKAAAEINRFPASWQKVLSMIRSAASQDTAFVPYLQWLSN